MIEGLSQNKWKYATIGLVGVILLGAIIPQANATTDISQLTQQILNIVKSTTYGNQAIMNAITGLRGSSASATSVNNLQTSVNYLQGNVTELSEKVDALANNTGAFKMLGPFFVVPYDGALNRGQNCVSDHAYKLYMHIRDDADNDDDRIIINGNYWYYGNADYDVVLGAQANYHINAYDQRDGDTGASASIFMETAEGATASCTNFS